MAARPQGAWCLLGYNALHWDTAGHHLQRCQHRGSDQHQAIVDQEIFDAVQERMQRSVAIYHARPRRGPTGSLKGKIFDDRGHPMSPSAGRATTGKLNRYYVSQAVIRHDRGEAGSLPRVPAEPTEALVSRELAARVDPMKVAENPMVALQRVVVSKGGVELTFDPETLRIEALDAHDPGAPVVLRIPVVLKTFGGAKELIDPSGASVRPVGPDLALQKAIARARAWAAQIASGERASIDDIAAVERQQSRYIEKVVGLAWLAPDITEEILAGRRLRDYNLTELLLLDMPLDWEKQRARLALV